MLTKTFLAPPTPNPKALNRSKAWTCVVINQLAFPGMGTVMAGRWSGYLQSAIMLGGFFLTMGFMCCYFASLFSFMAHSEGGEPHLKELCGPYAWAGVSGVALCLVAWGWALVSSIAIMRGVSAPEQKPLSVEPDN